MIKTKLYVKGIRIESDYTLVKSFVRVTFYFGNDAGEITQNMPIKKAQEWSSLFAKGSRTVEFNLKPTKNRKSK